MACSKTEQKLESSRISDHGYKNNDSLLVGAATHRRCMLRDVSVAAFSVSGRFRGTAEDRDPLLPRLEYQPVPRCCAAHISHRHGVEDCGAGLQRRVARPGRTEAR